MSHRTQRVVWRLRGSDPIGFLEATTTQDHQGQAVGEARWCCVLDPHGRVLAFLRSIPIDEATVLLDGEPACQHGVDWLASIAGLSRVSIDVADDLAVVAGDAPEPNALASAPRSDGLEGADSIVASSREASVDADEAARIERGWPRFGIEITGDDILNDTPLLALCTSFTKGCYRGQETVAKIRNLGHARRAFVRVRADSRLEPGPIAVGDVEIGMVRSVAGAAGIGIVRAEHQTASDAAIGGVPARLEPLVIAADPGQAPPPPEGRPLSRAFGRR